MQQTLPEGPTMEKTLLVRPTLEVLTLEFRRNPVETSPQGKLADHHRETRRDERT